MATSPAVRAPRQGAEATRRRLRELGVLRTDLDVARDGDDVLFPVAESCGPRLPVEPWEFTSRNRGPQTYLELLHWPADRLAMAPRAFEHLGDIVVVKVPREVQELPDAAQAAAELGDALLRFHAARAVFHDAGVKGEFRTRELQRIAGTGDSLTRVAENGVQLWVDLAKAYFSPRLATERARVASLVKPGEHLVDLFGGVAPQGIQAAKRGAEVDSIDLNPDAILLARRNRGENRIPEEHLRLHLGDARAVAAAAAPADRVVMNLPHGAKHFLDVAARILKPDATLHYHEILPPESVEVRSREVEATLTELGWSGGVVGTRTVRNYSPQEAHIVFDLVGGTAHRL